MTMRICAARNYNHRQTGIHNRSVRSEQSQPRSLTDAGPRFSGDGLFGTIRFFPGTVIDGANHTWNHSLPGFIVHVNLAANFRLE